MAIKLRVEIDRAGLWYIVQVFIKASKAPKPGAIMSTIIFLSLLVERIFLQFDYNPSQWFGSCEDHGEIPFSVS